MTPWGARALAGVRLGRGGGWRLPRLGQSERALHAGGESDAPLAQLVGDEGHDHGPIQQREQPERLDVRQLLPGGEEAQEAADVPLDVAGGAASLRPLRSWAVKVDGLHQELLERLEVRAQGPLRQVRGCEAVLLGPACTRKIILLF